MRPPLIGLAVALLVAACLPAPKEHAGFLARVTYYAEPGMTYGGTWTTPGRTAACSWNFPLFATVAVDGDVYVCEDRGALGSDGWIDIFAPDGASWVPQRYGDWAFVETD